MPRFKREIDLVGMCLNVIVDNIHIYSEPCKSLEIYVEYLRRGFSDELFYMITKKYLAPEKQLEWLLNPYWKDVCLTGAGYSVSNIINKLQIVGKNINSLNLENSHASADMLAAVICCVPNVTNISLKWTNCNDAVLALLTKVCASLVGLNLAQCSDVTDEGMLHLCATSNTTHCFKSLKALNIFKTSVTEESIPLILKDLKSLEVLKYECLSIILYNLHKSDIVTKHSTELVKYNLTDFVHKPSCLASLNEILKVWTVVCPYVTTVHIEDAAHKGYLQLCSKFEHLKKLQFFVTTDTPRNGAISEFMTVRGETITVLEILFGLVSAEVISRLCHNLEKLFLLNITFENFDQSTVSKDVHKLYNLKSLTIKHLNLSLEPDLKSVHLLVTSSINLTELSIQYAANFTKNIGNFIVKSPKLAMVNFSFTDIRPTTLLKFFECETITEIRADGCPYISETDGNSGISKLIDTSDYGNTFSWKIDYSII